MLNRRAVMISVLGACAWLSTPARAQSTGAAVRVSQHEVAAAMRVEQARGYDLRATVNAARLQAAVILRLARAAHARDSLGPPFIIGFDTYQAAFEDATGVASDALPVFIRMASRYGENLVIEHRRSLVIAAVVEGPAPQLVVRVRGGWDGAPASYAFEDSSSTPTMHVVHDRDTRFIIADYGDLVMHDEVRGLRGRATSGLLGALMAVLGDATLTHSRFAVADDGTMILRGTVRKLMTFTWTVMVTPDGRTTQGVPDERADLLQIERRLQRRQLLRYVPDGPDINAPAWEPRRP